MVSQQNTHHVWKEVIQWNTHPEKQYVAKSSFNSNVVCADHGSRCHDNDIIYNILKLSGLSAMSEVTF